MNEDKQTAVAEVKQNLPLSGNDISALNLSNPDDMERFKVVALQMMGSDKGGIKSIQDAVALFIRSKDLGLPFSTSIEHIHVVNGKTGIDVHIMKALLSKAGVTWEQLSDYAPLYEYTDGNNVYNELLLPSYAVKCKSKSDAEKIVDDDLVGIYPVKYYQDFKGTIYKDYQLNGNFVVVSGMAEATKVVNDGKAKGVVKIPIIRIANIPVDYITKYKFTRYNIINGTRITTTSESKFTYSEAMVAELFTKDTYKKYARTLIGHRAFTYGARDIASDVLLGCMETTELKIINNMDITEADVISVD